MYVNFELMTNSYNYNAYIGIFSFKYNEMHGLKIFKALISLAWRLVGDLVATRVSVVLGDVA